MSSTREAAPEVWYSKEIVGIWAKGIWSPLYINFWLLGKLNEQTDEGVSNPVGSET
jgi:hypothetical protein